MKNKKNLFVDLDGSLIKGDLLYESFFNFLSNDILAPIKCLAILIKFGLVELKSFLYKNSFLNVKNLPIDRDVLKFIENWKTKNNGDVVLISASHELYVQDIAKHINIFDACYGSSNNNLKSTQKLKTINNYSQDIPFDYVGNSIDDLAIWEYASNPILVNSSNYVKNKVKKLKKNFIIISNKKSLFYNLFKLIRAHQWIKNMLLFLPMVLSMSFSLDLFVETLMGFVSFSLIASAFYVFNDLLDIESDRKHITKKFRPLASGQVNIISSVLCFLTFIAVSVSISFYLSQTFQAALFFYACLTFIYSKWLKKIPVVDIIILASFYVVRILSGSAISGLEVSNWLITFSMFFFLFLASVKRWIEIEKSTDELISARGYFRKDLNFITQLSFFCGLISVLILCLYIDSQQASLIYSNHRVLWFVPMIFLYWIVETLFLVSRNKVNDDPVVYALKSKTSYICAIFLISIFYFAS